MRRRLSKSESVKYRGEHNLEVDGQGFTPGPAPGAQIERMNDFATPLTVNRPDACPSVFQQIADRSLP